MCPISHYIGSRNQNVYMFYLIQLQLLYQWCKLIGTGICFDIRSHTIWTILLKKTKLLTCWHIVYVIKLFSNLFWPSCIIIHILHCVQPWQVLYVGTISWVFADVLHRISQFWFKLLPLRVIFCSRISFLILKDIMCSVSLLSCHLFIILNASHGHCTGLLGTLAPCVLYGSNAERIGSSPGSFTNHCLPYTGLFLIGQSFFGWNCMAPWFSYPSRTAIRQRFNLEVGCLLAFFFLLYYQVFYLCWFYKLVFWFL